MAEGSRQWHEKLPFALLGYRTTVRTSVGATPYLLVYGIEAVIPAEIEITSLQIVAEAEIDDDEWVKTRLEQLSLIDEKRLVAVCHDQLYQQRRTRAYNKKVRPRKFEEGQQMLRRILPHQAEAKGSAKVPSVKWFSNFVGDAKLQIDRSEMQHNSWVQRQQFQMNSSSFSDQAPTRRAREYSSSFGN
ncbi:uncharacterized protein [Nicotiana sylvestris]|uniref:uncharacterized protein n=1 Tax=Nicotiana sylvestris TaxID=4096 RepID=UPI00388CCC92